MMVKKIVGEYLRANGYDGLVAEEAAAALGKFLRGR